MGHEPRARTGRPAIGRVVLLVAATLLVAGTSCRAGRLDRVRTGPGQSVETPAEAPGPDDETLESMGLERKWDLPIRDQRLVSAHLVRDRLYVMTADDELYVVDAETGETRWVYQELEELTFPPTTYSYPEPPEEEDREPPPDDVYLISKHVLHVLDEHGNVRWTRRLDFTPSTGAVGNRSRIFIGGFDDRVHAIDKRSRFEDWAYRTRGPITARPEIGEISGGETPEQILVVASEDGTLYSFEPATGERRGSYETAGPIRQRPVYYRDRLYFASDDYNAYSLQIANITTRPPEWVFPAGGRIPRAIAPFRGGIYVQVVRTVHEGASSRREPILFSLRRSGEYVEASGETIPAGTPNWALRGGERVVARGDHLVYALDTEGTLHGIELEGSIPREGEEAPAPDVRWTADFTREADFVLTNRNDPTTFREAEQAVSGRIYTVHENGWIVVYGEQPRY